MSRKEVESLKELARLVLLATVSWLLTEGAVEWLLVVLFGQEIDPVSKAQIVLLATMVLRSIDKYLHEHGKTTGNESLEKGLTRF